MKTRTMPIKRAQTIAELVLTRSVPILRTGTDESRGIPMPALLLDTTKRRDLQDLPRVLHQELIPARTRGSISTRWGILTAAGMPSIVWLSVRIRQPVKVQFRLAFLPDLLVADKLILLGTAATGHLVFGLASPDGKLMQPGLVVPISKAQVVAILTQVQQRGAA